MKKRSQLYEVSIDGYQFWCRFKSDAHALKKHWKEKESDELFSITLIESDHRRIGQYLASVPDNRMLVCSQDVTRTNVQRRKHFGYNCPFPQE